MVAGNSCHFVWGTLWARAEVDMTVSVQWYLGGGDNIVTLGRGAQAP